MKSKVQITSRKSNYIIIMMTLCVLLFLTIFFTTIGSINLAFSEVWRALKIDEVSVERTIVHSMRLPRNIMAVLVGANLAISGILLQAVMKNPLADPGITGVSSGASVVAIFIILVVPSFIPALPLFAFIGGAIACVLVFLLAWKNGIQPIRIVLAGVAVNAVLGGFISMLSILYSDRIQSALLWLNGSLAGSTWRDVGILLPYSVVGLIAGLFLIRSANVLQLGDEAAKNLGFNVTTTRLILSAVAVFFAGVTTSFVGIIGFIGLIVPHVARMLMGSDHKYTIPFSMVLGGLVLLIADTLGRSAFGPIEIPVGIITAIVGGPFFLYLLRKSKHV